MTMVLVTLDGADELGMLDVNLDETSDEQLQKMLQDNLCGRDAEFCSCCIGLVTFRIKRDCKHKISIWPQKDGTDIVLYVEN